MKTFLSALVLACALLLPVPADAATGKAAKKVAISNEGIAATVNDDAITMSDVVERMKLIIVSSGMPNTPDMQQRLKPQIINMLIEEAIQRQQARSMNLKVTPEEIANGFATIANNNKIDPEHFRAALKHDGISTRTMEKQIESQIAWGKVVQRKIRPQIEVNETDIDAREQLLRTSVGQTQYAVAQIFLPVDVPQQDGDVRALAQKLINEMKTNHAPFPQVAAQFSQEAAAARGGDLGWLQIDQLPDTVAQAVTAMKEGDVSPPVRSPAGYHIVLLRGKRTVALENMPTRDQIMEQIGTERLDRAQRRFLMDLKSGAFIERRV